MSISVKTYIKSRILMFCTFLIMAAIEVSLFIDKPNARLFAATILVFGPILCGLVTERSQKKAASIGPTNEIRKAEAAPVFNAPIGVTSGLAMLCAVRGIGRTLNFALQEARETGRPLYLLFVREQPILAPEDRKRKWVDDEEVRYHR